MKKGFTLIELLATIVIIGITITIVAVKIEGNLKKAENLKYNNQIETVELSAIIYANEYDELINLPTSKVDTVSLITLIDKGFLTEEAISELSENGYVIIADINGELKAKYTENTENIIFLNGAENLSIFVDKTYTELGAYVAIPNTDLVSLTNSNITSNINTSLPGNYIVTYSYPNAESVIRKVSVID